MEELGDKPDAYDVRYTIADHFMKPEYKEGYLEFTDLSTLAERLKGQRMIRYIYRSPNEQWIAINAIPQKWDEKGNLVEVLFATRNVSEGRNRELEQEDALRLALASVEHANKAKTAFLNNMSHDIRTPMNAIIGFTALAVIHVDQPEVVKDYLTKIGTSSQHLLSLINDVLDMSRIESGTVKIEENEVHIPDVLHDLRTIIQGNIHAKQHDLYIDTQTSVYKGYKQDKIEMRGDRAEMSDFPLYLNTVAGGLDRRDQTIGGFSFVVKIYAVPVVEIIGQLLYLLGRYGFNAQFGDCL